MQTGMSFPAASFSEKNRDGALRALGRNISFIQIGVMGGAARLSKSARELLARYRQTLTVPCCRMQTLLRDYRLRKLDLVVIDTEGADWMVARQLPLMALKPRLIYMEHDHLPLRERLACRQRLTAAGYRVRLDRRRRENLLAVARYGLG
jgi:hypothetical protein